MRFPIQSLYKWYRNAIRNPKYRLWVIMGTLIYLVSPIDISPDLIPILGQIDDFAILTIFLTEIWGLVSDNLRSEQSNDSTPSIKDTSGETIDVDAVSVDS
ncbi:MAG: DUF1232 domain-containing protein [Cyanobacteria bacterium QH_8_48_120]|nr:MAG: DUF1232 domain-containing protein [Cyanobacteria bacterium QH_1_48_107]PSO54925.1 MAG: DUF1232 domain-containing protein [Cyanobacteria bacterium QH_10_48_56]PSO60194.1 MAG: DUF1232 domain-containing protein [Cyanobacteria bacterium QH_7_48_89]PSO61562.1 MAG: DUF1232 domain-containing protein [Cyanobacteria bacterium QH_2_48_84]PSO66550.1 MAG: DUF1232 domain-containing protein [Cyanobacteria bacterium QH_6_48_35]PSO67115.1 MAG: DUF1232 domain-containing protein [Cyanobacteria bacterium